MNRNNASNYTSRKRRFIRILFLILISIALPLHIAAMKVFTYSFSIISNNKSVSTITLSKKQDKECVVCVKERPGRLGNRMFIVASAYGLARLHSCHLYLTPEIINEMKPSFIFDLAPFLISTITFNKIVQGTSKSITRTSKDIVCQYIPELTRPNAISSGYIFELKGYWQSYLHFTKYGDDIRQLVFAATQSVIKKVSQLFIDIYELNIEYKPKFSLESHQLFKKQLAQSNWTTWIGIHIRRSDFVSIQFSSSDTYLFAAIEYYTLHYPNANFIVASDDKPYCKNLFRNRSNIFLTPESFSVDDDLITLSLCEHSILTGGTFGWWAGYLANGQVLHDNVYPSGCERREYYYPPWFLIDGNVRAHKNSSYTL
ncbi:unnamed protein product [Rotaria socialis]|uniref:L-Fucosyltransferase n=1 Tax=Rotaria socialis TaxID=392032 RepID=A0A817QLI1_9BILA|nr:unnamed protein product [Rotaria socialis]CAF4498983.1 unnamed protein product [Rotaria socialis]